MATYLDHRAGNIVFEHLAALTWEDASFADPGQPAERLFALRMTGNFFALFGVAPMMGRIFTDADDQTGAEPVVVLSDGLWQRRFNGDAAIVGRSLRLDGREATVIGVMPRDFQLSAFLGNIDLWLPFAASPELRQSRGNNYLREFGRLKPGVTPDQADAAMRPIARQVLAENTNLDQREPCALESLSLVHPVMRGISAFGFGLTFLVLLIACVAWPTCNWREQRRGPASSRFAAPSAGAKGRLLSSR